MSTKSKNLIILIGNIGSGKSTYTKKYQKKGYVVIARDQLRYAIGGGQYVYKRKYESIIWEADFYMFANFLDMGVDIVLDEININKKMRMQYIVYAKEKGYKITAIEMPKFSKTESVARRMTNPHGQPNKKLWNSVWSKFDKMYEKPTKQEGIHKIIKVKKYEVS